MKVVHSDSQLSFTVTINNFPFSGAPVKRRSLGFDADADGDSLYGDGMDLETANDVKIEPSKGTKDKPVQML